LTNNLSSSYNKKPQKICYKENADLKKEPKTVKELEQEIVKFQIQINELKIKMLKAQFKLLRVNNEKFSSFDDTICESYPNKSG
jgi:hypothetical protein